MNAYLLYLSPGACSLAAHIALEETGAPFDTEIVSVAQQQNLGARYLAINPKARVPALAIPGEPRVLTETPAILTYLARRHPDAQLLPLDDPLREARCHEWLAWLVGWVHGVGYGALWRPGRFAGDAALHGAISAHGRGVIDAANASIEALLADGRAWAEPGGHSIVDPFLLVLYRWGVAIGLDMTRHRAWSAHAAREMQRPAAQRALAREAV
ncbi:glutathione S-transferase N-terminal domain-containing protein [Burkholderia pseudomultivorans]|uniref:glutathione S-transferase family protein n=1 Tax=Burkholderia pseudomultivorans TaxID=1207504 RepID=UPI00075B0483|nr:glutathione S-transferase [Burkholderia pseudomultivorans]AOI93524.1 glutathione S-transferase [Burkholderia pseudomultivorans]KVC54884.1 glutathione S-transferase [Burkholderia pseudomultivorans]MDS0793988.1 glutathione S-transferase N-terminal domain-containing protein [Burkholderia pseudomultivorans]